MRLIDADELYVDARCGENEEPYISLYQINDAPTIDVEPVKHGRWIMKPNGYGTCSNCKVCSLDIMGGVHSNYCPNCGAKMTLD